MSEPSQRASSADEIKQNHDDGDYQENMDEAAHRVGTDEPEEPQYEKDNRNRIEHEIHLCVVRFPRCWLMYPQAV
jgi:hypothetical protein